ncbi:MAG: pentapeptide repeat-containing protein [Gammaproteobacteria bacterium]|nr:pentapeptide repeat-containing protein [Gammaproteobacteria bacterium]
MTELPKILDDPLYKLLRDGRVREFNEQVTQGETCDLRGTDLRCLDLRHLQAKGLDLSNCYLRQADLRGVNLFETQLEGANINGAKISGTYFPKELSAEEINLSLLHGTRMRYRCNTTE